MIKKNLGKIVAEFPPDLSRKNPRNSEGAFISLIDGRVLFVYSRFKGNSCADAASADIYSTTSADDGRTFCESRLVISCEEENAVNIMSLSLLRMGNGDVGLFYLVRETYTRLLMYLRRSNDEGETWGPRILCTPLDGFYVVNNDRVIRMSNNRILIPAAVHRTGTDYRGFDKKTYFDDHSQLVFFYSDDDGNTWTPSQSKVTMPYNSEACKSGLQEPGVIELNNGVLWNWARTDLGRQYESFSFDHGDHWTVCQPSRFSAPNSPLCMKKNGNMLLAVWNPIPEYIGREKPEGVFLGGRTPFVMAISKDEGRTFSDPIAFEWDDNSGYCYCAIHFTQEALLLAYCAGSVTDGGCLNRIRIRRIPIEELNVFR